MERRRMMKNKTTIGIGAGAVALLIAGVLTVRQAPAPADDDDSATEDRRLGDDDETTPLPDDDDTSDPDGDCLAALGDIKDCDAWVRTGHAISPWSYDGVDITYGGNDWAADVVLPPEKEVCGLAWNDGASKRLSLEWTGTAYDPTSLDMGEGYQQWACP